MKELFFTAQTAIPPGVGFPYYGTVHLLWLLAISGICCCTACLLRRQEAAVRHRCLLLFCVAGIGGFANLIINGRKLPSVT